MALEHFDVLVIGAGISGVDAAYRLQTECPDRSYAILEGRDAMGGTWDLFRYPGIRSDSDMFTLGYPFRPWKEAKSIADGSSILAYIRETAEEFGIDRRIRFGRRVTRASWSSADAAWTVEVDRTDGGGPERYTCGFLFTCCGYYSYEAGYQPTFPGIERYEGTLVHPQKWPEDLDYQGKQVVVIGSGATAVTLVPAMAPDTAHITMLQRSPSYVMALPGVDPLATMVRKRLPEKLAHSILRWKNVLLTTAFYQFCRRRPKLARKLLRSGAARLLPPGFEVDPHFNPTYDPWDQRMCLVPDGDLFRAIRSGKATVVTDTIDTFTERGIRLASGTELDADIVVSATGLTLVAAGGIALDVDGEPVKAGDRLMYKGHMLSGVPNFAVCLGYTNASWTLRADLTARSVCRLLNHMAAHGYTSATPTVDETSVEERPILGLNSGYIQRAVDILPKQGSKAPWYLRQNYLLDSFSTRFGKVGDSIEFGRAGARADASVGVDAG